jgi:hypothetical protein
MGMSMGEIRSHVSPEEGQRVCQLVRAAVRRGELKKPSICSWCGDDSQPIEAHHPDYNRPLMVVWICRPCHKKHTAMYASERWLFDDSKRPCGHLPKC